MTHLRTHLRSLALDLLLKVYSLFIANFKHLCKLELGGKSLLFCIIHDSKILKVLIDIEVLQGCHHPCICLSVKLDHPKTIYAAYTQIYYLLSNLNKETTIFDISGGLEPQTFFLASVSSMYVHSLFFHPALTFVLNFIHWNLFKDWLSSCLRFGHIEISGVQSFLEKSGVLSKHRKEVRGASCGGGEEQEDTEIRDRDQEGLKTWIGELSEQLFVQDTTIKDWISQPKALSNSCLKDFFLCDDHLSQFDWYCASQTSKMLIHNLPFPS